MPKTIHLGASGPTVYKSAVEFDAPVTLYPGDDFTLDLTLSVKNVSERTVYMDQLDYKVVIYTERPGNWPRSEGPLGRFWNRIRRA